jgi:hypothetical protein
MLFLSHTCYKNNMSSAARHDRRHALRGLARTPGITAVAVVTLALGIGATTAIFSVVHGVLLKPFGYQRVVRLLRLYENVPASENAGGRPRRRSAFSRAELGELRHRARTLSHVAGHSWSIVTLTGRQEATRVQVAPVSPEIFTMVGAAPLVGRLFDAGDAARGAAVAVLSHRLWQQQFGGDPDASAARSHYTVSSHEATRSHTHSSALCHRLFSFLSRTRRGTCGSRCRPAAAASVRSSRASPTTHPWRRPPLKPRRSSSHVRRGVGVVCRRRRVRVLDTGPACDRGRSDDRASLRVN